MEHPMDKYEFPKNTIKDKITLILWIATFLLLCSGGMFLFYSFFNFMFNL
ncbi:hypothetical protein PANI_CDS0013 [Maribacter phage Panino]